MNRITIERNATTRGGQQCLDLLRDNCTLSGTRSQVAEKVRFYGLAPYVGGHHVAVHEFDDLHGERLAIITGDGPDWR